MTNSEDYPERIIWLGFLIEATSDLLCLSDLICFLTARQRRAVGYPGHSAGGSLGSIYDLDRTTSPAHQHHSPMPVAASQSPEPS